MTGVLWLADSYDLLILDLDGTVYLGPEAIPGAAAGIAAAAGRGSRIAYATNNAARRASEVAAHLIDLGIPAQAADITTAAEVAAALAAQHLTPGDPVLIVGGPALRGEVADAGLMPVSGADDKPHAVIQGYAADVGWRQLAEACVAVRGGATWIATNADKTLPSPRGPLPGNGSLVAALATALGREPDVIVGKPAPALFHRAAERIEASRPLVVGDRLDTDIAGAVAAKMDSLFVLTGVSTPTDLLAAPAEHRPTFIASGLDGLVGGAVGVPVVDRSGAAESGGWTARPAEDGLDLVGSGTPLHALAALAGAVWAQDGVRAAGAFEVRTTDPAVRALLDG